MNIQLSAGPPSTPANRLAALERDRLLDAQLGRIREAATTWRNALAAALAGLIGFSLVKGRSDVGQLAKPWSYVAGCLLAVALVCGALGALALIRSATGRPAVVALEPGLGRQALDHIESQAATKALRRGIGLTLACVALLATAVGTTWYGPQAKPSTMKVTTSGEGTVCGTVVRVEKGTLVLKTEAGEVVMTLAEASAIQPVPVCSPT